MTVSSALSILLAVIFGWAAAAKLLAWRRWRALLQGYGFEGSVGSLVALGVPAAEAIAAILLLAGGARMGGALALVLISSFSLAVLRARSIQGDKVPCGCFGRADERDYRQLLGRNLLLAVVAGVLLVLHGSGAGDATEVSAPPVVPALLVGVGVTLIAWLVWTVASALRGRGPG
jgi:hypothetical protein